MSYHRQPRHALFKQRIRNLATESACQRKKAENGDLTTLRQRWTIRSPNFPRFRMSSLRQQPVRDQNWRAEGRYDNFCVSANLELCYRAAPTPPTLLPPLVTGAVSLWRDSITTSFLVTRNDSWAWPRRGVGRASEAPPSSLLGRRNIRQVRPHGVSVVSYIYIVTDSFC